MASSPPQEDNCTRLRLSLVDQDESLSISLLSSDNGINPFAASAIKPRKNDSLQADDLSIITNPHINHVNTRVNHQGEGEELEEQEEQEDNKSLRLSDEWVENYQLPNFNNNNNYDDDDDELNNSSSSDDDDDLDFEEQIKKQRESNDLKPLSPFISVPRSLDSDNNNNNIIINNNNNNNNDLKSKRLSNQVEGLIKRDNLPNDINFLEIELEQLNKILPKPKYDSQIFDNNNYYHNNDNNNDNNNDDNDNDNDYTIPLQPPIRKTSKGDNLLNKDYENSTESLALFRTNSKNNLLKETILKSNFNSEENLSRSKSVNSNIESNSSSKLKDFANISYDAIIDLNDNSLSNDKIKFPTRMSSKIITNVSESGVYTPEEIQRIMKLPTGFNPIDNNIINNNNNNNNNNNYSPKEGFAPFIRSRTSSKTILNNSKEISNNNNNKQFDESIIDNSIINDNKNKNKTPIFISKTNKNINNNNNNNNNSIIPLSINNNIYPAMLSQVSKSFKYEISLGTYEKDSLIFTDCFLGKDAVDVIAKIIKTNDRNLALILGRALDNQGLFHEVTYNNRLRDSSTELYKFKNSTFTLDNGTGNDDDKPNGVFTLLTNCYSPTCTKSKLCYSIVCPRRLEQQARLLAKKKRNETIISTTKSPSTPYSSSIITSALPSSPYNTNNNSIIVDVNNELTNIPRNSSYLANSIFTENENTTTNNNNNNNAELDDRIIKSPLLSNIDQNNYDFKQNNIGDGNMFGISSGETWSATVGQNILESTDINEIKRQEVIFECISTERDYVTDLETIRDVFIEPLKNSNIIPNDRKMEFINNVFLNLSDLLLIHTKLLRRLLVRQKRKAIVENIGDIFMDAMNNISLVYLFYGKQQTFAKHILDCERQDNIEFSNFLNDCEKNPLCRKLPIYSFLARPTTRLGRYPLLLKTIKEKCKIDNPDKIILENAINEISKILHDINIEVGKSENTLKLTQLNQHIIFAPGEQTDLGLLEKERRMIRDGVVFMKKNTTDQEITLFLLDNCLLVTKKKKNRYFKVSRSPIPLELLLLRDGQAHDELVQSGIFYSNLCNDDTSSMVSSMNNLNNNNNNNNNSNNNGINNGNGNNINNNIINNNNNNMNMNNYNNMNNNYNKNVHSITISHLGRVGGTYTFYVRSHADKEAWIKAINEETSKRTRNFQMFGVRMYSDILFPVTNKINCSAIYGGYLLIGTDHGVFSGPLSVLTPNNNNNNQEINPDTTELIESLQDQSILETSSNNLINMTKKILPRPSPLTRTLSDAGIGRYFRKLLDLDNVTQIDTFPAAELIAVVSDKVLYSFTVDVLIGTEGVDPMMLAKKGKKLSSHVAFFRSGKYHERDLLCLVKHTALTSTIKVLEPVGMAEAQRKTSKRSFFRGNDSIEVFKEFYIPTESSSLYFMKSKLCVGCAKGFEIVDLETLETQGLLDPHDMRLDFVFKRDNLKPMAIFRIFERGISDFLICYNEFAFFIDKLGRRSNDDLIIQWLGNPICFSYVPPYIIAYEASFIEVRNVDDGSLVQVIPAVNLRSMNADSSNLHCAVDGKKGYQNIFKLYIIDPTNPQYMADQLLHQAKQRALLQFHQQQVNAHRQILQLIS